jgi:hypothetical protein
MSADSMPSNPENISFYTFFRSCFSRTNSPATSSQIAASNPNIGGWLRKSPSSSDLPGGRDRTEIHRRQAPPTGRKPLITCD